jgi:hypothetical protein
MRQGLILYDNFDYDLGFEPSLIRTSTTVAPLLHWLSTMHNAIDFVEKGFPASESRTQATMDKRNMKS